MGWQPFATELLHENNAFFHSCCSLQTFLLSMFDLLCQILFFIILNSSVGVSCGKCEWSMICESTGISNTSNYLTPVVCCLNATAPRTSSSKSGCSIQLLILGIQNRSILLQIELIALFWVMENKPKPQNHLQQETCKFYSN